MDDPATKAEARRERARQYQREYYARNREQIREKRERNSHRVATYELHWAHGPGFKAWRQAAWRMQDGLCYLCQQELGPHRMAVVEHDHRCHPPKKSCDVCRRGLACDPCNRIIGFADDDPDRLELVARNLRTARDAVTARLAGQES